MARSPCPLGTNQICKLESYIRRSHYKFVVFSGKQTAAIEKLIITASGITKGCKLRLDCYFIGQKLLLLSWKIVLGNRKIVAVTIVSHRDRQSELKKWFNQQEKLKELILLPSIINAASSVLEWNIGLLHQSSAGPIAG